MLKKLTVLASFILVTISQQAYDFGGLTYPFRNEYTTFQTVDGNGNLIGYGFYMKRPSESGLPDSSSTTVATPYALVQYFNRTAAPLIPFEFLHLHYNPLGHTGGEGAWAFSHYDFHLFFEKPEYVRGIACPPSHGSGCSNNPLFSIKPDPIYLPEGFTAYEDPVEQMGIHIYDPDTLQTSFSLTPANLYGSFDGRVIFQEPMVSLDTINNIVNSVSKVQTFSFPRPQRHEHPGLYFDTVEILYQTSPSIVKVTFKDLYRAPEWYRDVPVYFGQLHTIVSSPANAGAPVSNGYDCYYRNEDTNDISAGFQVVLASSSEKVCCISRLNKVAGVCTTGCANTPFTGTYFQDLALKCYTNCYERV